MSEVWGVAPETLLLTSKGYEPISSLEKEDKVSIWNGYDFEETAVVKMASDIPLLHIKTENTLELFCSKDFTFILRDETKVTAENLTLDMKLASIPNCPIAEGGDKDFPFAYTHGFYSGSERYWRDRLKVSRATIRGVRHGILSYLALDHEKTTKTSLFFDENIPANFEVPLDPEYSVDTKLDWLAGVFDSGLMKRKLDPHKIWILHSDNVDFLYQVKLLLQTLGVDSRHVSNVDHRFQHYSLRIRDKAIEVLIDLGLPTLSRNLTRSEFPYKNKTSIRSTTPISIEDALRSSDIYNFTNKTHKSAVFNGMFTATN